MTVDTALSQRLQPIRAIVLDVDGVLTDGSIILHDERSEIKSFNVQDGFGITLARQAGLITALLTGRICPPVEKRAKELKFDYYEAGHFHKAPALEAMMERAKLSKEEVLYMGDDILDLSCRPFVGVFVAPANARARVKTEADWVTEASGGMGAVREMIDTLLNAKDLLQATENYFLTNN